jgi:hypothetical protein
VIAPMSNERREIKFRPDATLLRRLRWVLYCEPEMSQQEAMSAALQMWLETYGAKWGDPVDPKTQESPKRKLSGRS